MSPRTPGREPLTPARIVAAAVAVADADGASAITMRNVAKQLDVEAMAIYHHLANKRELVSATIDAIFAEITPPEPTSGLQDGLESYARASRATLLKHGWVLALAESREHVGTSRLTLYDAVLGLLLSRGLDAERAVMAVAVLDSYIYGSVIQERQHAARPESETSQIADETARELDEKQLPHLKSIAATIAASGPPSFEDTFEMGLATIVRGLMDMQAR